MTAIPNRPYYEVHTPGTNLLELSRIKVDRYSYIAHRAKPKSTPSVDDVKRLVKHFYPGAVFGKYFPGPPVGRRWFITFSNGMRLEAATHYELWDQAVTYAEGTLRITGQLP